VQFFPPKNRAPTNSEIKVCKPFLERQLNIINPKIIVLLGSIAAHAVIGTEKVMKHHGELLHNKYFITIHPSAAVRLKKNVEIIRQDFEKLKKIIKDFK
jgi:DNA polymerase